MKKNEAVQSRHSQVTAALRAKILDGVYAPGERLPTIHELAAEYETSYFTVQTALTPLVEQGLVQRRRRVGTVVCQDVGVITRAAIYCSSAFVDEPQYAFARELCGQLQRQCADAGVSTRLFTDLRSAGEHTKALPELAEAVEVNQVHGILAPLYDVASTSWLESLGVPICFVHGSVQHAIGFNTGQLLDLALTRLRERGCRTVGLISPDLGICERAGRRAPVGEMFVAGATDLGLQVDDAWLKVHKVDGHGHEHLGYNGFSEIWAQERRPDGLLVYPDTVARGVTTAVLEQSVRVPEELKLVFHKNGGIDWPCPPAVDWVVSDVARWAAEMIGMLRRLKKGEDPKPVTLDYELQNHGGGNRDDH